MQPAGARRLRDEDAGHEQLPRARNLHLVGDVEPFVAENGRRTVRISGNPGPARRRRSPAAAQIEARPDRVALWAVLLGLFLVFMAVATANAATF
jgi:hypothetical protein